MADVTVRQQRQEAQWWNAGKGMGKGRASVLQTGWHIDRDFVEANLTVTLKNSKYTQHLTQQIPLSGT